MKWTSKDAGFFFNRDENISVMYKRRFQAFFLYITAKGDKLKNVDIANPKPEELQEAFNGAGDFIEYGDSVEGDAAVLTYLWLSVDKDKKIDYQAFEKIIGDKEIDEKFISEAKRQDVYNKCLSKLELLQEKGEREAKIEISKGGRFEFSDRDKDMISTTMSQETLDVVEESVKKYGSWEKVKDSSAVENLIGTKQGSEFWGKGKYDSIGQALGAAKNTIYDTVMSPNTQTNILTAPLKLFFFSLHELLNPNSLFRKNTLPWLKTQLNKILENQKLKDEYKKLGVDIDKAVREEPNEENRRNAKTYNKQVSILQRELARGYDFKKDLEAVQVKKENTVKEAEEQPAQPNPEQDLDNQAAAGDNEKAQKDQVNDSKAVEKEMEEMQDRVANVIMRYNCLIYIFMRAFAGTFSTAEAYRIFSFSPFTLTKKEAEKRKELKQPEQNPDDHFSKLGDKDKDILRKNKINGMDDVQKISKAERFIRSRALKNAGVSDGALRTLGLIESDITLKDLRNYYLKEAENGANRDVASNSDAGSDQQTQIAQNQNQQKSQTSQKSDGETYTLSLTQGADHWIKRDRMMNILITRTPELRQEVIRDARYSTFFVYVNLMELFLKEYQQYIQAVENHPDFEKFRNSTIRISQIKDLRLVQTTTNLEKVIRYMFQNVVTDKGLRTQLIKSMNPIWIFKKITSIQQFLTIKNMDFTNIKKWIAMILPRLERVMRTTAVQCEIKKDAIENIFGKNGIPFSFIDQSEEKNEEKQTQENNGEQKQ